MTATTARPATFRPVLAKDLRPGRNVRDDLGDLTDLAASIRANGILQPLVVNDLCGDLVITDGHRRYAAARLAGIPILPCIVTDAADEKQVTTTMLAAAMHKQLTPIEQGRAFSRLLAQGMTRVEIARSTGYSANLVATRLLLLELPAEAQDMLDDGDLTVGAAVDLAKQVKAKRNGNVSANTGRSAWFTKAHALAGAVADCPHGDRRTLVGGVACGQCWEAAIRADERGESLTCPPPFDEVAVDRILTGQTVPSLARADRLEAVRRLHARGWSDARIAAQVRCSDRQVLRDRQHLDLPGNTEQTPDQQDRRTA